MFSSRFTRFAFLPYLLSVASICFSILLSASPARAQNSVPINTPAQAPQFFDFVTPWDDAEHGVATDMSYLNAVPAGANGRIIAKNGHFYESKTNKRVCFLGVNFTFGFDFPPHADAEAIAAHMQKLGVNIVRIHHEDADWNPIWDKAAPGHHTLSAEGMERLDYLVYQLKKHGVYVNLNLHVSREFVPEDGFPDSIAHTGRPYNKMIDNIDQAMIGLQKQFAHDYLTHVNKYTGLSYANDPCVAIVEINNENSTVESWSSTTSYYKELPEPFHSEVVRAWNDWLIKKYGTDRKLRTAWIQRYQVPIGDLLSSADKWTFQNVNKDSLLDVADANNSNCPASIHITTVTPDATAWHTAVVLTPLTLKEGVAYTLSFDARADANRQINVETSINHPDWHNVGLAESTQVGTEWGHYQFTFTADSVDANNNRIVFSVGGDKVGETWVRNVALRTTTSDTLLPASQLLVNRSIDIPTGLRSELTDWVHFLSDLQTRYADTMRSYLRNDLHVHANLVDSQMEFGQNTSFAREAGSDFVDSHEYWHHPNFPGVDWNGQYWHVAQSPLANEFMDGKGGAILWSMALNRVANKPFAVSEFNEPAPSDYRCEAMPMISTYGAFQDWDMIYMFDYGAYGAGMPNDRIQYYFATGSDPARAVFFPSSALIFRRGKIATATKVAEIRMPESETYAHLHMYQSLSQIKDAPQILNERVQVKIDPTVSKVSVNRSGVGANASSQIGIHTSRNENGGLYVAQGGSAVVVAGFIGGQKISAYPLEMNVTPFGNQFAAVTLVSRDTESIHSSKSLLLTAAGKCENHNMVFIPDRTSCGDHWGDGPTQVETITADVTIYDPLIKHVWALDSCGKRKIALQVTPMPDGCRFDIAPSYQTVWYELAP